MTKTSFEPVTTSIEWTEIVVRVNSNAARQFEKYLADKGLSDIARLGKRSGRAVAEAYERHLGQFGRWVSNSEVKRVNYWLQYTEIIYFGEKPALGLVESFYVQGQFVRREWSFPHTEISSIKARLQREGKMINHSVDYQFPIKDDKI